MKIRLISCLFVLMAFGALHAQPYDRLIAGLTTDKQKADTLLKLAVRCFKQSKLDSAYYLLAKGKVYADNTHNDKLIAGYLLQMGYVHLMKKEFDEGLHLLKASVPYMSDISDYELQVKYFYLSARFCESLHHNDSAIYYYHQLEAINNKENPYNNWVVYTQLAQLFKASDAYEPAETYFDKAYQLTKPRGIRMDHVMVLNQFADLYYQWDKHEKFAELMYEQQQMMGTSHRDYAKDPVHSMFFINWNNKPLSYKLAFMKNVKSELQRNGHVVKAALANNYIADFFEKNNQPDSALSYIRENQVFFNQEHDINHLYSNTLVAYRLLKKMGNTAKATEEADKLFAWKDSIIQLQQRATVLELETKYETDKKEKDILLLRAKNELNAYKLAEATGIQELLTRENLLKDSVVKREKEYNNLLARENGLRKSQLDNELALKAALSRENNLKAIQLAKEKNIRRQLAVGAALLLLSGIVIFVLYRRQKSKNLVIQKQAEDLQVLMKEIHHRVKNNLQVISSLLDLQSLSIKDSQASEAIKESRNRVYSMALIHQDLYQDDHILGIEMNNYINKLVQSLFASYQAGEHNIMLETDIDPLLLDVDMVIPIGLVLNELISNSLKYAFSMTENGKLQIALTKTGNDMLLKVKDNGSGFPKGMNVFTNDSFGYKLVKAFAKKLKAKLEVFNDNGACIMLYIKNVKAA